MPYKNKEEQRIAQRDYQRRKRVKIQDEVYKLLGNECAHCGINDKRVFQIDHIEPLRRKERKDRLSTTGATLRMYILNGTVTKDSVQLLCANCHQIKTYKERHKYGWVQK